MRDDPTTLLLRELRDVWRYLYTLAETAESDESCGIATIHALTLWRAIGRLEALAEAITAAELALRDEYPGNPTRTH